MNLKLWTKISNHFSVKKTILLYHDSKIFVGEEKNSKFTIKTLINFTFLLSI